jgi:hypothetical protein
MLYQRIPVIFLPFKKNRTLIVSIFAGWKRGQGWGRLLAPTVGTAMTIIIGFSFKNKLSELV